MQYFEERAVQQLWPQVPVGVLLHALVQGSSVFTPDRYTTGADIKFAP